jgi:hypothetical protein
MDFLAHPMGFFHPQNYPWYDFPAEFDTITSDRSRLSELPDSFYRNNGLEKEYARFCRRGKRIQLKLAADLDSLSFFLSLFSFECVIRDARPVSDDLGFSPLAGGPQPDAVRACRVMGPLMGLHGGCLRGGRGTSCQRPAGIQRFMSIQKGSN